jgi:acyl carrier protein phosphodiesterase
MNHLAHLLLAENSPEIKLGNFLGDFVTGQDLQQFSEAIQWGIRCHQKIDAFTDSHPIFQTSKRRIAPERRRFAGIMVDIFYDHFLANNWENYIPESLVHFSQNFYQLLQQYQSVLPLALQRALPFLIKEDWFNTYRTIEGIELTLWRVSRRLTRENPLARGILDLRTQYPAFEQDFLQFWPEIFAYAQTLRRSPGQH